MPFIPFHTDGSQAQTFCQELAEADIAIYPGVPDLLHPVKGKLSQGECRRFPAEIGWYDNYPLAFALVFDYDACGKNDKYQYGININDYGVDKCNQNFFNTLSAKCESL